ncbi:polygalacturonase inhibitor 1-like [Canna indica]|uniref:Polygalacturonase inhibitor 1-like n=1 Tax=Canna indica TaxID=4628 RepID=A0AAQ3KNW9_9LILI|nr:polygalacturonase inhibitor 1-like [Canna indica]
MSSPFLSSAFFFFLFFLTSSFTLPVASIDCNNGDREALLKIKAALGNPPQLSSWIPATNCCASWDNLYCDTDTGRVYNVYIYSADVSPGAALPAAFGDLSALESLSLQDMPGLTGPIPPSFAKLSRLYLLSISNTSVSGAIPGFLTTTNLSALVLPNNKLSGPIPRALSRLPYLRYVDLSNNELSGAIPPGLLHGDYQFLILSGNRLTGEIPKSYGEGDVNTIDVGRNRLTGNPAFLFNRTRPTKKLDLSWNELDFDITRAELPWQLEYLDLSHNRIRGGVPKSLKDLYQLLVLNLTYNQLCGEIPTGRAMTRHSADSYLHNKCLCGTPLPPCRHR